MVIDPGRRRVVAGSALCLAGALLRPSAAQANSLNQRPIPRTGERLPVVGLGDLAEPSTSVSVASTWRGAARCWRLFTPVAGA